MMFKADTKQNLVPYIMGKQNREERKGRELLEMFCAHGVRDAWKGGLPFYTNKEVRMFKKDYIESRLDLIDDSGIVSILTTVVNEAESVNTVEAINQLIIKDGYSAKKIDGTYVILGGVVNTNQSVSNQAHFLGIENKIITALDNAKVSIRLAMAWFTNDRLQAKLLQKLSEGLDIEIIIFKDGVNRKHGVDLTSFDVTEMRGTRGGFMHNKFCVLDNQVVISGSYNWSANAEFKNDENVTVTTDNALATQYSLEFRKLKS